MFEVRKVISIINYLVYSLDMNEFKIGMFALVKLVMLILYSAHICACLLYIFETWEKQYGVQYTWIDKMELNDKQWYDKYTAALYFSVITMITVGFGDINPVNTPEYILTIFITLVSCGIFAYCINSIGQIVQRLTQHKNNLQNQLSQLTTYMKMKNIQNRYLQIKIKQYYQYLYNEEHKEYKIGEQIVKSLVGNVKREVMVEIYGQILKKSKFFKLNFSTEFIEELSQNMQELKIAPQHQIPENSKDLYFMISGIINQQIESQHGNTTLQVIKEGQIFNKNCDNSRFVAQNVVQVAYLKYDNFYQTLKRFPNDQEKFFQFKDLYNYSNIQRGLGVQCQICKQYDHDFMDCSSVFYICNKDKHIYRYNSQNGYQERQRYLRSILINNHSLFNSDVLRDEGIRFILTYSQFPNQKELIINLKKIQKAHLRYYNYTNKKFKKELIFPTTKKELEYYTTPKNSYQLQQGININNRVPTICSNCSQLSALNTITDSQVGQTSYQRQTTGRQGTIESINKIDNINNNEQLAVSNTDINLYSSQDQKNNTQIQNKFNGQNSPTIQSQQIKNNHLEKVRNIQEYVRNDSSISNSRNNSKRTTKKQNSIMLDTNLDFATLNYIRQQATKSTRTQSLNKTKLQQQQQQSSDDQHYTEIIIQQAEESPFRRSQKTLSNFNKNKKKMSSPILKNLRNLETHSSGSLLDLNFNQQQQQQQQNNQNQLFKEVSPSQKSQQKSDIQNIENSMDNLEKSVVSQYRKGSQKVMIKNLTKYATNNDIYSAYTLQSSSTQNQLLSDSDTLEDTDIENVEEDQQMGLYNNHNNDQNISFSCEPELDKIYITKHFFVKSNHTYVIDRYNKKIGQKLKKVEKKTNQMYELFLQKSEKFISKNRNSIANDSRIVSKKKESNKLYQQMKKRQSVQPLLNIQPINNNFIISQNSKIVNFVGREKKLSRFANKEATNVISENNSNSKSINSSDDKSSETNESIFNSSSQHNMSYVQILQNKDSQ